jgi:DNA topoisomerase-1
MTPAVMDAVAVDVQAENYTLRANGSTVKFKGFTTIYTESKEEGKESEAGEDDGRLLPPLEEQQRLALEALRPEQKFTQPPPRYNDATLVKALEEENIGRPSTYAPIISTILGRMYIERRENRFYPTELGTMINDLLVLHFPNILNVEFTAKMENGLDEVEEGKTEWVAVLREFYTPFQVELEKAKDEMHDVKADVEVELEQVCEKCGAKMTVKWGRHGKFIACSNYPTCRNTKRMKVEADGTIGIMQEETVEEACERCGKPMVIKYGRFGKFLACSGYPECKSTKPINKEIGMPCPIPGCTGQVIERRSKRGRMFYGCSRYPQCQFSSWDKPLAEACPKCAHPYLVHKQSKKLGEQILCPKEGCGYSRPVQELDSGEEPKA